MIRGVVLFGIKCQYDLHQSSGFYKRRIPGMHFWGRMMEQAASEWMQGLKAVMCSHFTMGLFAMKSGSCSYITFTMALMHSPIQPFKWI